MRTSAARHAPVFPRYLAFCYYPRRWLYIATLVGGIATGAVLSASDVGNLVVAGAAILVPVSALLLHIAVAALLSGSHVPTSGRLLSAGAQVVVEADVEPNRR